VVRERHVHLARAQDNALDLVVGLDLARFVGRVWDDPLEVRVADELADVGARLRVAQKTLAKEQDQGWRC
jgi:hypothetical protein